MSPTIVGCGEGHAAPAALEHGEQGQEGGDQQPPPNHLAKPKELIHRRSECLAGCDSIHRRQIDTAELSSWVVQQQQQQRGTLGRLGRPGTGAARG